MILGIPGFEESTFTEEKREWEEGDLLVLYSDGITEAENAHEELFGDERLKKIVLENRDKSPAHVKDCILNEVTLHCEGLGQSDDITLVILKNSSPK